jgi:hypothetical protein
MMLNIDRELLELTESAGDDGPCLPAPAIVSEPVARLIRTGLLAIADSACQRLEIADLGKAALRE